jgi:hypothetical protein
MEKTTKYGAFCSVLLTKCYAGDRIRSEICRECSTDVSREVHRGYWCGNLRERDHLEDIGVDRRIILRWIIRKWDMAVWTELLWLRIGTGGGLL